VTGYASTALNYSPSVLTPDRELICRRVCLPRAHGASPPSVPTRLRGRAPSPSESRHEL
jgi:hypothetical protein